MTGFLAIFNETHSFLCKNSLLQATPSASPWLPMYGEKLDCNHFPGWFYLLGRAWSVRGWCMLSVQVCGLCWCLVPPILQAPPFITPIPCAIWPPYTIHMLELANNCLFVEGFYLSIARTGLWNAHTNPLLSGRIPPLYMWLSACLPAYLSRFQNWNSVWLIKLWWNYWVLVIFIMSVQISYTSTTNLLIQYMYRFRFRKRVIPLQYKITV